MRILVLGILVVEIMTRYRRIHPYGESSYGEFCNMENCPMENLNYGELSYGELFYGELSYGELSYGEFAGHLATWLSQQFYGNSCAQVMIF